MKSFHIVARVRGEERGAEPAVTSPPHQTSLFQQCYKLVSDWPKSRACQHCGETAATPPRPLSITLIILYYLFTLLTFNRFTKAKSFRNRYLKASASLLDNILLPKFIKSLVHYSFQRSSLYLFSKGTTLQRGSRQRLRSVCNRVVVCRAGFIQCFEVYCDVYIIYNLFSCPC